MLIYNTEILKHTTPAKQWRYSVIYTVDFYKLHDFNAVDVRPSVEYVKLLVLFVNGELWPVMRILWEFIFRM
jgi:hypothetical protein